MHRSSSRRALVAGIALVAAAACGGDKNSSTPTGPTGFSGSYSLRTVNDTTLPYLLFVDSSAAPTSLFLVQDVLTFDGHGNVTEAVRLRSVVGSQAQLQAQSSLAQYDVSGSQLVILGQQFADTLAISGTTLTETIRDTDGSVVLKLVYRKD